MNFAFIFTKFVSMEVFSVIKCLSCYRDIFFRPPPCVAHTQQSLPASRSEMLSISCLFSEMNPDILLGLKKNLRWKHKPNTFTLGWNSNLILHFCDSLTFSLFRSCEKNKHKSFKNLSPTYLSNKKIYHSTFWEVCQLTKPLLIASLYYSAT